MLHSAKKRAGSDMAVPKKTVLILDTDEVTCVLYRREVGRCFYVLTCTNKKEAWKTLEKQPVDTIVLEPTALDNEDWGFVIRLRASEHCNGIPIVVCSTLDARRRGADMGVTVYLTKPVTPQILSGALQTALQGNAPIAET